MTPLVIGIGDPAHGDDGAGPRLVELLASRGAHVDCLAVERLGPELAEAVSAHDPVVFVDASVRVRSLTIGALRDDGGPWAELGLTARHPHAFLVHIPAIELDRREHLSALAANSVVGAVEPVLALLRASTDLRS